MDASEVNKNIVVDHCVEGDAKVVLRKLSAQLNKMEHAEWMAYIAELKNVNIDTLTPIEALNLVYSLKKELNHEA